MTHGAPGRVERSGRGHAGRRHDVLGERLRALDPRRRRARPEDRDADVAQLVGRAGHERRLRPDDGEVDAQVAGELDEPLDVLAANGMAAVQPRDARVAGRGVELREPRAAHERARQRMLATARADEEDPHGASLVRRSGGQAQRSSASRAWVLAAETTLPLRS